MTTASGSISSSFNWTWPERAPYFYSLGRGHEDPLKITFKKKNRPRGFFFFSAKIMAFWANQNLPIIWHLYTGNPGIKSLNAIWKYWFLKCNVHYILTSLLAYIPWSTTRTLIHSYDRRQWVRQYIWFG